MIVKHVAQKRKIPYFCLVNIPMPVVTVQLSFDCLIISVLYVDR
jgi:hypothetical protein